MRYSSSALAISANGKKMTDPYGLVVVQERITGQVKELPLEFLADALADFRDRNFGVAANDVSAAAKALRGDAKAEAGPEAAKAAERATHTATGSLKGKYAYMSP